MMRIEAVIKFGQEHIGNEWEHIKASETHYLVLFRLRNDLPVVIRLETTRIQANAKNNDVYMGDLDANSAFVLKRA